MGFEGELASYDPLRRLLDSEKVKLLQERLKIRQQQKSGEEYGISIIRKSELIESSLQPDLILAIDGSYQVHKVQFFTVKLKVPLEAISFPHFLN